MKNKILKEDMVFIYNSLSKKEVAKFQNATVLITGCSGFLGFYFMHFLSSYSKKLKIKKIIGLDNFILRHPTWIKKLEKKYDNVKIHKFDVIKDNIETIPSAKNADLIIHMASIASPTFYRKYPIETLDANIWGLRNLLEYYKDKKIKGFLFFSSSEVYGNPNKSNIPTDETYFGNVSAIGPRACYDEAKRFGETMCYLFAKEHNIPVTIARPFNNYGPGMDLNDKRVPADFAKSVIENKDIVIFSDGTPTRTFCYISDAIIGYIKTLLYGKFDYFNIGIDTPEISINKLAHIYVKKANLIYKSNLKVVYQAPKDIDYLTDNPDRRCPNIDKARNLLNYKPTINIEQGISRFLKFIKFESIKND